MSKITTDPENKYPLKTDDLKWVEYYKFLEALRRTGVCNMWGAGIYLEEAFQLSSKEASEVLCNWINNYDELNKIFEWQNP